LVAAHVDLLHTTIEECGCASIVVPGIDGQVPVQVPPRSVSFAAVDGDGLTTGEPESRKVEDEVFGSVNHPPTQSRGLLPSVLDADEFPVQAGIGSVVVARWSETDPLDPDLGRRRDGGAKKADEDRNHAKSTPPIACHTRRICLDGGARLPVRPMTPLLL